MTDEEILEGLDVIIADVAGLPYGTVTLDQDIDGLDVDSLSLEEIAVTANAAFGTEIPAGHLERLASVGDIVTAVREHQAAPGARKAAL